MSKLVNQDELNRYLLLQELIVEADDGDEVEFLAELEQLSEWYERMGIDIDGYCKMVG